MTTWPDLERLLGQSVVTARLSRALGGSVTIPLTLTAGTAESGDYGPLSSITIDANTLTGSGTVTTARDRGDERSPWRSAVCQRR